MKTILLLLPTVLSLLVLAAHFMRSASVPLVSLSLAMILLLFVKRSWAARTLQVALLLAAIEWIFTAVNVIHERQADGRDFGRAALIFVIVALLNIVAAFLYRTPRLARRYRLVSTAPADAMPKTSVQGA